MADDDRTRNCDDEDIICGELLTRDPAYPSAAILTGEAFAVNPRFVKEKLSSECFLRHDIVSKLRLVTLCCVCARMIVSLLTYLMSIACLPVCLTTASCTSLCTCMCECMYPHV